MKSASAAYWIPVTVNEIAQKPQRYEGYSETTHDAIDEWFSNALDYFTDIYGTVVDAHYIVEDVYTDTENDYVFHISVVVTGMVDSEVGFSDAVYDNWGSDIVEQLKVSTEKVDMDNIVGYDFNPALNEPTWEQFNE